MSMWAQAAEHAWALALVTVPLSLPVIIVQWFSARKTRRMNTAEHGINGAMFKAAADNAEKAARYSKAAAHEARGARIKVAEVDGRLTGYIDAHNKVHEDLRR